MALAQLKIILMRDYAKAHKPSSRTKCFQTACTEPLKLRESSKFTKFTSLHQAYLGSFIFVIFNLLCFIQLNEVREIRLVELCSNSEVAVKIVS